MSQDPHTLARWRLVLGKAAEAHSITCAGLDNAERIDQLVGFLFDGEGEKTGTPGVRSRHGQRTGGGGPSQMTVPEWVDLVSELFPQQAKEVLERELVQRR